MKVLWLLVAVLCSFALLVGCTTVNEPTAAPSERTPTSTSTTTAPSSTTTTGSTEAAQVSPPVENAQPTDPVTTATVPSPTGGWISETDAKAAAFDHAGVKEADVFDLHVELDREDDVPVYDIDFETNEFEFEYEINAEFGTVVRSQKERQDDRPSSTTTAKKTSATKPTQATITADKAKATALTLAGVKESDVFDLEVDLDKERSTWVYEISFETTEFEFEYEIDAISGEALHSHKEPQR